MFLVHYPGRGSGEIAWVMVPHGKAQTTLGLSGFTGELVKGAM